MLSLGLGITTVPVLHRIGGGGGPAPFDPTDWSGCTLDLVAEDCVLTVNTASWSSRVGSITFSGSGTGTPIAGNPLNGRATIRFSGFQYLTTATTLATILPTATDWTVFMVLVPKVYTNVADFSTYINGDTYFGDSAECFGIQGDNSNGGRVVAGNLNGVYYRAHRKVAVNTPVAVGFRGSVAAGASRFSVGSSFTSARSPTDTTSSNIATRTNALRIGGQSGAGHYGNFEVARIFAYDRALSDVEYAAVLAGLEAEYGLAPYLWTPDSPITPYSWVTVEAGRVWQDTAATLAAAIPGDPIGRINAKAGNNLLQSTISRKPYLATLGSRLAARSDDVDDGIGLSFGPSVGAKTIGILWEQFSQPSGTGSETIARLGFNTNQTVIRHSGLSASAAKGFHFVVDRGTASASCIQAAGGPALLSNGIHSLVIRYDGVNNALASSYRAWLDGNELALAVGGNVAAAGDTRWLSTSALSEVFNGSVAESVIWTSMLTPEDCLAMSAYLEAFR